MDQPHSVFTPRLPATGDSADSIQAFLTAAHASDLALWLGELPEDEAWRMLMTLDVRRRADVVIHLTRDTQVEFARSIERQDLADLVCEMDPDDRVDLFNELSPDEQQDLIQHLPDDVADNIRGLASHAEGSVGAIMTTGFATLRSEMTAKEAISALRRQAHYAETIYRSYVVDDKKRLIGAIRLHELILAPDDTLVSDLMDAAPASVTLSMDQEKAARMIARYDILALPVIDAHGRLVGIVTHDDASDAMQEETTEDFHRLSTVMPFTETLREAGIRVLYSRRIVWLALLIFGNLFSGAGIAYFEDTILAYVSLVFFLPLLIDSSGNAGSQSATLMVRALATGDVALKDWRNLLGREFIVAALLGVTMALVVMPLGAFRAGPEIAVVVGLTMVAVVMIGSVVGMSLPFLLSRFKIDPATASGPLVTTIADAAGVLIYFTIATTLLGI